MTSVTIDMSGTVALVTGGGYGMGRASARRFAECGARNFNTLALSVAHIQ
jgi:NAD(P)-dependent dehydrogenase (short-subunit alcohol dehydrogenase family)